MNRVLVPRKVYAIRFNPDGMAEIDKAAEQEGITRSKMIRRLCAEALQARQERIKR